MLDKLKCFLFSSLAAISTFSSNTFFPWSFSFPSWWNVILSLAAFNCSLNLRHIWTLKINQSICLTNHFSILVIINGLFRINKNKSIPLIDSNSAVIDRISVFQMSNNFSNLNLIKYNSRKTFLQKYLNLILFPYDI